MFLSLFLSIFGKRKQEQSEKLVSMTENEFITFILRNAYDNRLGGVFEAVNETTTAKVNISGFYKLTIIDTVMYVSLKEVFNCLKNANPLGLTVAAVEQNPFRVKKTKLFYMTQKFLPSQLTLNYVADDELDWIIKYTI